MSLTAFGTMSLLKGCALALFLVLWPLVAWIDLRRKKILHGTLAAGLAATLLGYAVLCANSWLGYQGRAPVYHEWAHFTVIAGHVAVSWGVAIALWRLGIWPAGDVKLFALLSAIYPLMAIERTPSIPASGLTILINIFLPAAALVVTRSIIHFWHTRMKHSALFLRELGWSSALRYFWSLRPAVPNIGQATASALRSPSLWAPSAARWLTSLAFTSVLSFLFKDSLGSPALSSLLFLGMFFVWNRLSEAIGSNASAALALAGIGAAAAWLPGERWSGLAGYFTHIGLFGFFLLLGTRAVEWCLNGRLEFLNFLGLGLCLLPLARGSTHVMLALVGVFLGLALVLVRIWEEEIHPIATVEQIQPYNVLSRSFVRRLQDDDDFFQTHFETMYADGLSSRQAKALKGWCRRNSIEHIPLSGTMSFGFWIFLGFFLTWLLDNHVLSLLAR